MGTVIYSASPLTAFSSLLITVLFVSGLGLAGLTAAFLQRNQGKGARITMAIAGMVLLVFGCATAVVSFVSISSGAESVSVRLNDKTVATSNCGDNGGTCTDYILETSAGQVFYDFVVNPRTYDLARVDACYQVTFYKAKSLIDPVADTESYHRIEAVTRIETADPAACQ